MLSKQHQVTQPAYQKPVKFSADRRANYLTIPWFKIHSHSHEKRKPVASYSMTKTYLKNVFHGKDKEPHPFHIKSDWGPPVQPSFALETFLEEVKCELANIKFNRPKENLSQGDRKARKELSRDKNIVMTSYLCGTQAETK